MLEIAMTGGIACGKSFVAALVKQKGIPVCDSDALAHEVIAKGGSAFTDIVAAFGDEIVGEDGEIDRGKLAEIVFTNETRRDKLNSIVHPQVIAKWNEWLAVKESEGNEAAVVLIPLLYEIGDEASWDRVICVTANKATQESRLASRGLTAEAIAQRIDAQLPVYEKSVSADFVIDNNYSEKITDAQLEKVLGRVLRR